MKIALRSCLAILVAASGLAGGASALTQLIGEASLHNWCADFRLDFITMGPSTSPRSVRPVPSRFVKS